MSEFYHIYRIDTYPCMVEKRYISRRGAGARRKAFPLMNFLPVHFCTSLSASQRLCGKIFLPDIQTGKQE